MPNKSSGGAKRKKKLLPIKKAIERGEDVYGALRAIGYSTAEALQLVAEATE